MADLSDSISNSDESADEGPSNPIAEAKRLGANLSTPKKAKIARERKIQINPAGKSRSERGENDPKLSSWQRVQEHKDEYLTAVSGKLRCEACKETISKKSSTVKKHIQSAKHVKAKKAVLDSKKKDQSVLDLIRRNDQAKHPKGETLPLDMRLYRFELIECFLAAGIPLSKIDCLRSFLEKYGHRLTSDSHLRELVPSVLAKEKETLKSELSQVKAVSTIFDGSTRLGEALAIVVRFVDSHWNVQQRLVRLQVLAKSLKANELAQCLIQALAVDFSIQPGALLAAMKDGASVNKAALQQVKFFFPQLLDVTCFSHIIDNVGKHFEFRVLDTFAQYWVSMFSHSAAVRLAWKTKTGTAMRSYSPTRWWSKWETMKQVLDYFGDVEPFLMENDHLVPATRVHLLEIFNSPADSKDLELELAAFVDGGNHFVSATYYLEGDGPLVFSCYERLATVSHSVALANYPNVEGVARRQANGNVPVFNQLVARAKACINPGLQFYQRKFSQEFYDIVRAFRSARLCCPVQVQQLHPTVASVEELRKFSFLDDDGIIQGLTAELPRYMAIADGTALETEEEKLLWWSRNEATLPNWSSAVKKVLLVQPSSASAERVFSLMKNFFGNQQDAALEETVEASVMLRYNQNQRRKVVVL
ncbi:hypothetical protein QZH41_007769 [Actinostola sp. cb2023]|nr:hypothetical protein QZH41_007769 [Actinostola sp. cb2023]